MLTERIIMVRRTTKITPNKDDPGISLLNYTPYWRLWKIIHRLHLTSLCLAGQYWLLWVYSYIRHAIKRNRSSLSRLVGLIAAGLLIYHPVITGTTSHHVISLDCNPVQTSKDSATVGLMKICRYFYPLNLDGGSIPWCNRFMCKR